MSLLITLGTPRRFTKFSREWTQDSPERECAISTSTARVVRHVKRAPYRLTLRRPRVVIMGPRKSIPTEENALLLNQSVDRVTCHLRVYWLSSINFTPLTFFDSSVNHSPDSLYHVSQLV